MKNLRLRELKKRAVEGDNDRQRGLMEEMRKSKKQRRDFDKACSETGGGRTHMQAPDFNPDEGIDSSFSYTSLFPSPSSICSFCQSVVRSVGRSFIR